MPRTTLSKDGTLTLDNNVMARETLTILHATKMRAVVDESG